MQVTETEIQSIIRSVIDRLGREAEAVAPRTQDRPTRHQKGAFDDLDAAINAAEHAQRALVALSLELRKTMIASVRQLLHRYVQELSDFAVAETKLGSRG